MNWITLSLRHATVERSTKRLAEATAAILGGRLTTIPVGHRVHSLAPDRFANEVLTFLGETVPRGAESSYR
ncbi:hypothetical protein BJ973_004611 [Actinoplanes tereljensis]|uniref:Uncharacterized protein n=1 Tax=Paractinoplanes tereljensis TaxID=571912 RepID=A0A919NTD7_9ACTN|nr:hypothetical protein Ate02nite_67280 [Actinoplanes tereljensis]